MDDEIREWQTHSAKHKIAMLLIMDGINFSYEEKTGIVFSAPEFYVKNMVHRLTTCYGVSLTPNY